MSAIAITAVPTGARRSTSPSRASRGPVPSRGVAQSQSQSQAQAEVLTSERTAGLRLTRRGRALVTGVALVVGLLGAVSAQSAVAGGPAEPQPVVTRTVVPGDTLWEIAATVAAPGEDLRIVVAELRDLNGLSGGDLRVGQQLLLPAD